MTKTSLIEQI